MTKHNPCQACEQSGRGRHAYWCPMRHEQAMNNLRDRQAIPPGGRSCTAADEQDHHSTLTLEEHVGVGRALRLLRDFVKRNVHCRGDGSPCYHEDEDNPWASNALGDWEDQTV